MVVSENAAEIRATVLRLSQECAKHLDLLVEHARVAGVSQQHALLQARLALFRSRLEAGEWSLVLSEEMDAWADEYNAFCESLEQ